MRLRLMMNALHPNATSSLCGAMAFATSIAVLRSYLPRAIVLRRTPSNALSTTFRERVPPDSPCRAPAKCATRTMAVTNPDDTPLRNLPPGLGGCAAERGAAARSAMPHIGRISAAVTRAITQFL